MNNTINNNERLNLKKLVDEMDCDDNTDNIRKLKHSVLIRNDIRKIENLKTKNAELKKSKFMKVEDC